jgi:hypothetical protein
LRRIDSIFRGYIDNTKNRSGGIILGYRQEIASKIKPLHTNSKYVFWFKVSSDLVNLDQVIIFGIVYIPPENTVYSSQDTFREIENEYNNFSINYKYISLIGDFNVRTSDEDDFFFSSETTFISVIPYSFIYNK